MAVPHGDCSKEASCDLEHRHVGLDATAAAESRGALRKAAGTDAIPRALATSPISGPARSAGTIGSTTTSSSKTPALPAAPSRSFAGPHDSLEVGEKISVTPPLPLTTFVAE